MQQKKGTKFLITCHNSVILSLAGDNFRHLRVKLQSNLLFLPLEIRTQQRWLLLNGKRPSPILLARKTYNFSNGRFIRYTIWCVSCYILSYVHSRRNREEKTINLDQSTKKKRKNELVDGVIRETKHKRKKHTEWFKRD